MNIWNDQLMDGNDGERKIQVVCIHIFCFSIQIYNFTIESDGFIINETLLVVSCSDIVRKRKETVVPHHLLIIDNHDEYC